MAIQTISETPDPLKHRDSPRDEITALTTRARSLYYPNNDPKDIEDNVLRNGTYVASPKVNTVYKVGEFPSDIGASNGQPSKWVKVESTSGTYHG